VDDIQLFLFFFRWSEKTKKKVHQNRILTQNKKGVEWRWHWFIDLAFVCGSLGD